MGEGRRGFSLVRPGNKESENLGTGEENVSQVASNKELVSEQKGRRRKTEVMHRK